MTPSPTPQVHRAALDWRFLAAIFALAALDATAQEPITMREDFWQTDGPVRTILVTNRSAFVGGQFSYLGPRTGGTGKANRLSGQSDASFPRINGTVLTAVPDGEDGWYIGGAFTSVGGLVRSNLARIRRDGSVDPNWIPDCNGPVFALATANNTVYVGGAFTQISGQARSGIAALNVLTASAGSWDPNASDVVRAIVPSGRRIFVGGAFISIGGQTRNRVAALDAETGRATEWNPDIGGESAAVTSIAISGNTLYVGGNFTSAGGKPRNRVAALDSDSGAATPWNPNADAAVTSIAVNGNSVFVGGQFTSIGAENRNRLASIDATTGRASNWNPDPDGDVLALVTLGDMVYAGGTFARIAGKPRFLVTALQASSGDVTDWSVPLSMLGSTARAGIAAISVSGEDVLLGGSFQSIGGVQRTNVAALDLQTGRATTWNPGVQGVVNALGFNSNLVYVAGSFTNVGGVARPFIAAVDAGTGTVNDWDAKMTGPAGSMVAAIAFGENRIYLAGSFATVGGSPRSGLASVRLDDGRVNSWNPSPTLAGSALLPMIAAIQLRDDTAYVGGNFDTIGGRLRPRLAAVSLSTALADAWEPNPSGPITALALADSTLYVGGNFTRIGGFARNQVCAFDLSKGSVTEWNPGADGPTPFVLALAPEPSTILIGGQFTSCGGEFRNQVANVDRANGRATAWNPDANANVRALVASSDAFLMGGDFTSMGGQLAAHFAVFSRRAYFDPPAIRINADRNAELSIVASSGQQLVIQASNDLTTWTNISTNTVMTSPLRVMDPQASNLPRRFYRLQHGLAP